MSQQENKQGRQNIDDDRLSWVLSGILIGTFLDISTTIILITTWVIVTNRPFPKVLGGYYPRDISSGLFNWIGTKFSRDHIKNTPDVLSEDGRTINTPVNSGRILNDLSNLEKSVPSEPSLLSSVQNISLVVPLQMTRETTSGKSERVVEQ